MGSRMRLALAAVAAAAGAWGQSSGFAPDTPAAPAVRDVTWQSLASNIASDQKMIWLFPANVIHGRHWKPVLAVTAATAALVALDPVDTPYFKKTSNFHWVNHTLSGADTQMGMALFPAAFLVGGLAARNPRATKTALFMGESLLDVEILTSVMKGIDRRLRPEVVPVNGNYSATWFKDKSGSWWRGSGSFPSGHTIAAFAIATVLARRYPEHPWIRYTAYGTAALIGFSRVALLSHFPSDVFMGAVLGYSVSRFAVLR